MIEKNDDASLIIENIEYTESNLKNSFSFMDTVDETNSTANVSGYSKLLTDIITRFMGESNLKHFVSIVPADTPNGDIPVSKIKISKNGSDADKTILIQLNNDSLNSGDGVTGDTSGATGIVLAISSENIALVEVTSEDTFNLDEDINTSTSTITHIFPNNWAVSVLMSESIDTQTTEEAETNRDMVDITFALELLRIKCESNSVSIGWTKEYLVDLITYGGKATNTRKMRAIKKLINIAVNVLDTIIKKKVLTFMKDNAKVRNTLDVTGSSGKGLHNIYGDIYSRINQSIGSIGTNTGIAGKYSVVASSSVYQGIITFLVGDIEHKEGYVLLPNGAKLIEDGYSATDYVLVTMADNNNSSAVLYSPYIMDVISAQDSVDFKDYINVFVRDDINNNAIVELDDGKSRMMEISIVTGIPHITKI